MAIVILVVDDEESIRDIFSRALIGPHEVNCAASGEDAVEFAKSSRIDLLLIDHRMGGIDGIQTFRRIRDLQPHIKAVLISGSLLEDSEKVKEAKSEGFFALLAKPVSVLQIREIVKDIGQAADRESP